MPVCVKPLVNIANGCKTVREAGGFVPFLMKCDYEFSLWTDTAEWEAAIVAGDIGILSPSLISKSAGSATSIKTTSQKTETPVNVVETLTIETLEVLESSLANGDDFTEMGVVAEGINSGGLRVGYIGTDGRIMLLPDNAKITVTSNFGSDSNTEAFSWQLSATYNQPKTNGHPVPLVPVGISLPLIAALKAL
jgi:hypothetical protein